MSRKLTPLLKKQVDELFLHWFSEVETQKQLRKELSKIRDGSPSVNNQRSPSPPRSSCNGFSVNNRPQSPPIPPSSPILSPRSPKRKISFSLFKKNSQRSLSLSTPEETCEKLYPGYAKNIQPFHFPHGNPEFARKCEKAVTALKVLFETLPDNVAKFSDFNLVMKACEYPLYWKAPFFNACGGKRNGCVTLNVCIGTFQKINALYYDDASQLFHMLAKKKKTYLEIEDFEMLVKDIINTHPGLTFLVDAPEFHSRYIVTVIARIFYVVNRSWNGRMTLKEFRKSNFLEVLHRLEEEEDINEIRDYFSYEHFYVIYCKFWELDSDHDMVISRQDLSSYSNGAISDTMVERIFSGCVTRGKSFKDNAMSYVDFVWFLLSEVDKLNPTSIEYWFRCMDIDGDGVISMYEMEYFFNDQLRKMGELGMETLSFSDCLCQIYDMVNPAVPHKITLTDLRRSKMADSFFDTFFNLEKWVEHEQKDPFQPCRDDRDEPLNAWDCFVMEEYELLVAEEGGTQNIDYEDDFMMDENSYEDLLKPTSFDDVSQKWSFASY